MSTRRPAGKFPSPLPSCPDRFIREQLTMPTAASALHLFLLAMIVFLAGAILPLPSGRRARLAHGLGVSCSLSGALAGILAAFKLLAGGEAQQFQLSWPSTGIEFALALDGLAAFFLLPLFLLVFFCSLYAFRYLEPAPRGFQAGRHWFFFNILAGSMALVVAAANSFIFLLAWELMSLSS